MTDKCDKWDFDPKNRRERSETQTNELVARIDREAARNALMAALRNAEKKDG